MFLYAVLFFSVVGNIVLGTMLYRFMRRRTQDQGSLVRTSEPERLDPFVAETREEVPSPTHTRPLHTFTASVGGGCRAGYWERDDSDGEPILALYFERGGEHVRGSDSAILVPPEHYLILQDQIRVVARHVFERDHHLANVAFTASERRMGAPAHSRTTLTGGKIELPQEEIDKIVAEHEFLAGVYAKDIEDIVTKAEAAKTKREAKRETETT